MKLVIQRVKDACVTAEGEETGRIGLGFLVLVGVMEGDTEELCGYLAEKTANLRVFTDGQDKLNLSLKDVGGQVLAVSNFTLGGDCKKGNRPSFILSAKQPLAEELYKLYVQRLREQGIPVETGRFGAHMEIQMTASGPITLVMDTDQMRKKPRAGNTP